MTDETTSHLAPQRPPTRLIARAMSQFLLSSARAWARPHTGDLTSAFVMCTTLTANLEHLGYGDPLAALASDGRDGGAALRRPISANAIAESLSLPYETVRRRTIAMIADGRLRRVEAGLIVPPETLAGVALGRAMREVCDLLDDTVVTLAGIGFDAHAIAASAGAAMPGPSAPPPPDALIARIALDAQIRSLETVASSFGDIVSAYVCATIVAANVRALTLDSELAWRYAAEDQSPPDALRRPVTIRDLARELAMPFETVRRHVRVLIERNAVVTVTARGVMVPRSVIEGADAVRHQARLMMEFVRMIGNLARAGYDFSPRTRAGPVLPVPPSPIVVPMPNRLT
ncbi:MAG: hypothetical protein V4537_08055 [Pseudomonadota bacterium]